MWQIEQVFYRHVNASRLLHFALLARAAHLLYRPMDATYVRTTKAVRMRAALPLFGSITFVCTVILGVAIPLMSHFYPRATLVKSLVELAIVLTTLTGVSYSAWRKVWPDALNEASIPRLDSSKILVSQRQQEAALTAGPFALGWYALTAFYALVLRGLIKMPFAPFSDSAASRLLCYLIAPLTVAGYAFFAIREDAMAELEETDPAVMLPITDLRVELDSFEQMARSALTRVRAIQRLTDERLALLADAQAEYSGVSQASELDEGVVAALLSVSERRSRWKVVRQNAFWCLAGAVLSAVSSYILPHGHIRF